MVGGSRIRPRTLARLREQRELVLGSTRLAAKLQLHLSPGLPMLHFRIVRHSFAVLSVARQIDDFSLS